MAQARTALDHLLDARAALVDEAERLAAMLADLESLIGTMGGEERLGGAGSAASGGGGGAANRIKAAAVAPARTATRSTARRSGGGRTGTRRPPTRSASAGDAPKSIRVHVLEMLGAENRDFGLSEIIDRVHDAGIPAHDDAVRSITIKLMKDGRVERVGRGQYRLARRGGNRAASEAEQSEPEQSEATGAAADAASAATDQSAADASDFSADGSEAVGESGEQAPGAPAAETPDYSPPLNLNEPWGNGQS